MSALFCTKCGAPIPEGAAFCTACGAPVAPVESSAAPPAPAAPAAPKRTGVPVWVWILIGALALALVAGGVWALVARPWENDAPVAEQPTSTASEEATETDAAEPEPEAEPEAVVSPYEGLPISTPQKGDATRTSLMDAARALTGSSAQFLVWQLYVQGDSAIGDIQEFKGEGKTPGRRWLVTWERSGGSWQGKTYVPFLDATPESVASESPFLTAAIVAKVQYVYPVDAPPGAQEAAEAAQGSDNGPFEIWVPTRLPKGFSFADEEVDPNWYRVTWTAGSKEIGMVQGWGDGEIGGAEDLVTAPTNWGPRDGWYLSSASLGYDEISGSTTATTELWGDIPEFLLRAVAMSMVEVAP